MIPDDVSRDSRPRLSFGVLGGSFDPPHYGHLALAETARIQLGLARVLFVPAGQPPHKTQQQLSDPEERVAMVQAAIDADAAFALSRVDVDRPGPHYSVEMLELLRAQYPEVTAWFFLMGEDSLHDLPTWYEPESLLQQATLAVMPRRSKRVDMDAFQAQFPQLAARMRLIWLDVPPVDFSATDLRRRARVGLPLRYLVPTAVEAYVQSKKLYARR
jgi:nicotinate-nucleotide adenylyltransferase